VYLLQGKGTFNTLHAYSSAIIWYFKNVLKKTCLKIDIGKLEEDILPLVTVKEFKILLSLT